MRASKTQTGRTIILALMTGALVASCGKKKKEEPAATPTSVADLKLSSTLKLDLPDGLDTAASASLSLGGANLVGKKSSEACRTMENVDHVLDNLKQIGGLFCHLEVESEQMKFGVKYNVAIVGEAGLTGGGGNNMSIWVDNSDAAIIKVYTCNDGVLGEQFSISGFAGSGKAKGSIFTKYTHVEGASTHSGGANIDFDFTQAGYKIVKAKMLNTSVGGEYAGTWRNSSDINLADSGLSAVKMSMSGTRGSDTFSDQGAVLFNGTMGQALMTGAGSYSGNTYDWTSRSTFDKDGITVAKATATADITVDKTTLPEKLSADFAPTAPTGWDCSGATESITVDMTVAAKKAAHDACSSNNEGNFKSCWGDEFENGEHE